MISRFLAYGAILLALFATGCADTLGRPMANSANELLQMHRSGQLSQGRYGETALSNERTFQSNPKNGNNLSAMPNKSSNGETKKGDFSRSEMTATSEDMRLILEKSCNAPFSKYVFEALSTDMKGSIKKEQGVYNRLSPSFDVLHVSFEKDHMLVKHVRTKNEFKANFCGGSSQDSEVSVGLMPAAYFPEEYLPTSLMSLSKKMRSDGSVIEEKPIVAKVQEEQVFGNQAEKRLLAYINKKRNEVIEKPKEEKKNSIKPSFYGSFKTIPEMMGIMKQNNSKRVGLGEKWYVARSAENSETFLLIGYKE